MHSSTSNPVNHVPRWVSAVADAPALVLPASRRPAAGRDTSSTALLPDVAAPLAALAAETGEPDETVLLAAWVLVLARTADQDDVVVGCYGDGDAADLTLVRVQVDMAAGFAQLVRRTAAAVREGRSRGSGTVAQLADALPAGPATDRPVLSAAFARRATPAALDLDDRRGPIAVLTWLDAEGRSAPAMETSTTALDPDVSARLPGHVGQVLRSAAADPRRGVAELVLITPDEVEQQERWNSTVHEVGAGVLDRFRAVVREQPDGVAVEHGDERLTYGDLDERATRLASQLVQLGVGPDVPVAVSVERSFEMLVSVLGVLLAGGAYVPVDPAYPDERRRWMLEDSRSPVLLTQRHLRATVSDSWSGTVLHVDAPPVDAGRERFDPHSDGMPADRLGYVIYTSGSTGRPKGVALPLAALDNLISWQLARPQWRARARTLQFASLSFDVSFQEIFSTWCSGGTLVLVDDAVRRDPRALLDHVRRHRVERLFLPFVALRTLAAAARGPAGPPASLREVYTAGEQLQVDDVLRDFFASLPGCSLENQYGPSESHVVTAHRLSGEPSSWPPLPPIGEPIWNSRVLVLDERGQRRPVGVPGELYLAGTCLARGYHHDPERTAERFLQDPTRAGERIYRTGDVVRWQSDGELEYLGRRDHQVKLRGYRVEPGEVSAALSAAPGVRQCVAAVREVRPGVQRLVAYLLPESPGSVDLRGVQRHASQQLPSQSVPTHYCLVETLPLTASGKIDTNALPPPTFDRQLLTAEYAPPVGEVETTLAGMWQELLSVPQVGRHDDWFELGGDSLVAAELLERIMEHLHRDLPLGALAQATTVAELAAVVTGGAQEAERVWDCLVPLRTGEGSPLFIVHGGSGNVASFPRLANALPASIPVFALQWDGLSGRRGSWTVEAMAARYLREVRRVQPAGPYALAGQCIGGLVAREMGRQLQESGEQVALLVMYDSPHLRSPAYSLTDSERRRFSARLVARRLKLALLRTKRATVGRPSASELRERRRALAMAAAAWRHRPGEPTRAIPTLYVGTGDPDGRTIALVGRWADGAMGWASHASSSFRIHQVDGGHNDILYSDEAVRLLKDALAEAGWLAASEVDA